ncbi:hypothetical protein [Patulibacter sp.]|uniref:hypothetical protein n=1 Tax=Patulibacter sp. TaxID=1912859 RepID=UPI002723F126|nr:hypothetical protein [Patulibacter sp.]MDO9407949.1 hypothetical protein [Patulibacter sp.]
MPKLLFWPAAIAVTAGLAVAPAAHAASPSVSVSATAITKNLSTKGTRSTVTVRNTGKARVTGLTLRGAGLKGVRASISGAKGGVRRLGTLRAGKSVKVRVTLRRTASGPKAGAFGLRVRKGKAAVASGRIAFGPKAAPAPPESLTGRWYWGSLFTTNGIQQYTLYFTGPDLVFTGDPDGAAPACAAVSEDCKPYTFDPKTKALTIDGKPATIEGTQLTEDGQGHSLLGVATPGARWDVTLTYSNSFGLCPLSCTYFTEDLTFKPDGTFVRGAVTSGSNPGGDFAAIPADRKGTYEIRADRTLRLAFADGKERIELLGIFPEDKTGATPANPTSGIVLDGDGYFAIRD